MVSTKGGPEGRGDVFKGGFMNPRNPFIGTFKHAPSSRTAAARYFQHAMKTPREYFTDRAKRHNPHTEHAGLKKIPLRDASPPPVRTKPSMRMSPIQASKSTGKKPGMILSGLGATGVSLTTFNDESKPMPATAAAPTAMPEAPMMMTRDPPVPSSSARSPPARQKRVPGVLDRSDSSIPVFVRNQTWSGSPSSRGLTGVPGEGPMSQPSLGKSVSAPSSAAIGGGGGGGGGGGSGVGGDGKDYESGSLADIHTDFRARMGASRPRPPRPPLRGLGPGILSGGMPETKPLVISTSRDGSTTVTPQGSPKAAEKSTAQAPNVSPNERPTHIEKFEKPFGVGRLVRDMFYGGGSIRFPDDASFANVHDFYELSDVWGDGGYATVHKGKALVGGDIVAIKCIVKSHLRSEEERAGITRETSIHARLEHKNIVSFLDAFEDENNLYFVMEAVEGVDLAKYLRSKVRPRLGEEEARHIFVQVLAAIEYCHDVARVVHCDLKPENMLLMPSPSLPASRETGRGAFFFSGALSIPKTALTTTLKLCDFGNARRSQDAHYYKKTKSATLVPFTHVTGTMGFIAPEILLQHPYSESADMWSLGVLLYTLLAGYCPFYPYTSCTREDVTFPPGVWKSINPEAKDLVTKLLSKDSAKRLTAREALEHPWTLPTLAW